jgi:hypothetical protein
MTTARNSATIDTGKINFHFHVDGHATFSRRLGGPDRRRREIAIDALTPTDWFRLRKFADYYIFLLGGKAYDRRADDLLSEAFTRFLDRTRKWDKTKVDFMGVLFGAIESISDSWNRKKSTPRIWLRWNVDFASCDWIDLTVLLGT